MGEYIGPLQELLVLPEIWGGHKLGDKCIPEEPTDITSAEQKKVVVNFKEALRKRQLKHLDSEARTLLKKLLSAQAHIAVPQFRKGECFDITLLPLGQVLRFQRDRVIGNNDGKPHFIRKDSWGVISELDKKRFVIEFNEVKSQNGIHYLGWSIASDFPPLVGEPIHLKPRQNIQDRDLPEAIERVNWIHAVSPTEPLFKPRSFVYPPEKGFRIIYQS